MSSLTDEPGGRFRQTRTICSAQALGTLIMGGIVLAAHRTGFRPARPLDAELLKTIYVVFVVVSATGFLGSIALRRLLLGDRFRTTREDAQAAAELHFMRTSVVSTALGEVGAVLGLVYFFLGGTQSDAILLVAIGFIGTANAVPRRWAYDDFVRGDGAPENDPAARSQSPT